MLVELTHYLTLLLISCAGRRVKGAPATDYLIIHSRSASGHNGLLRCKPSFRLNDTAADVQPAERQWLSQARLAFAAHGAMWHGAAQCFSSEHRSILSGRITRRRRTLALRRRLLHRHRCIHLALATLASAPAFCLAQDTPAEPNEAAPIIIDMAGPLEPEPKPAPAATEEPKALGVYRHYIELTETAEGAYAPGLSEQLLGLGLNLQMLERHEEAARVLKRGVHVSRIHSGLYAPDQIPLLRAEIRSLTALGAYEEVDERQGYLARVESETLDGTHASFEALLDQGDWQEQAYALELGKQEERFEYLARSWEYYRLAYNEAVELYGTRSLELLKPLEGMLRLQYRFAMLEKAAGRSAFDGSGYREASSLGSTYRRGEAVLSTIYGLRFENGSEAADQAHDLTRLGDWAWWMGRRSDAREYYAQAWRRVTPEPEPEPEPDPQAHAAPAAEVLADAETSAADEDTASQLTAAANSGNTLAEAEPAEAATAAESGAAIGTPIGAESTEATDRDETAAGEKAIVEAPAADEETPDDNSDDNTQSDGTILVLAGAELSVDDPIARAALFHTPTPLPDIVGLRSLPPFSRDDSGPVVVQFEVSSSGKITSAEQLTAATVETDESDENEEAASAPELENPAVDKLLRRLRQIRFRPRLEDGKAVRTEPIIWSFDLGPKPDAVALQPE